jgi:hypothetical protein
VDWRVVLDKRSDWGDDYASQGRRKSSHPAPTSYPDKRSDWGDDYASQGNRKSSHPAPTSYPVPKATDRVIRTNALTGAVMIPNKGRLEGVQPMKMHRYHPFVF